MKRLLTTFLLFAMFVISGYAQPLISVTATQRAGYNIDTTVFYLNPTKIVYVKKATAPIIGYIDAPKGDTVITYKVTQNFDTIVNRSNQAFANVVKLLNVTPVAGTSRDTSIQWAYSINDMVEVKAKTSVQLPKTKSTIASKYPCKAGYIRYNIEETPAIIKLRIDSLVRVARDSTF